MDSIISTFHIDWKIIIAQAINFCIVFFVLYVYAIKPLAKLMAERTDKITKGVDDAKTNKELLEKTTAEYEIVLSRAKIEADKIFQDGKKEAEMKKVAMMEDAKSEVVRMIEQGKRTLEAEKQKTVEEAKKEIVSLAMLATEKLLGNKADGDFNEKTTKELGNL